MIQVKLGSLTADKLSLGHASNFSPTTTVNVALKDNTSVVNPVFILSGNIFRDIFESNYLYCDTFRRYYYINDIIVLDNSRYEFHCHVDVLASFRSSILGARGYCTLSGIAPTGKDRFITDSRFPVSTLPAVQTYYFKGSDFKTYEAGVDNQIVVYALG